MKSSPGFETLSPDRDNAPGGLGDKRVDALGNAGHRGFADGRKVGGGDLVDGDDPAGPGDVVHASAQVDVDNKFGQCRNDEIHRVRDRGTPARKNVDRVPAAARC